MNDEMSIDELKDLLDAYDHAYYNLDEPVVSDVEYDALKMKYLRSIAGVEEYVQGGVSSKFTKVLHLYPILSLEKVRDKGTLRSALIRFKCGVIQPKLDGLTIVVYGPGVLGPDTVYSTRGNGIEGENVSETCKMIPGLVGIPNLTYRVEVFMPKAEFKKLNAERVAKGEEPFANPRNAAAGMIRQSDHTKVRGLSYLAYNILGTGLEETKQLALLKECGIRVVSSRSYTYDEESINNAIDWILNFTQDKQDALPYEIDGIVIKSDLPDSLEFFGSTGHHPKNAVAYKYPTEAVWTTLREVTWQLGKSGQVTPVALFDSVQLFGSTVSRATLHNLNYIRALSLQIGCKVAVTKANMIIPKIIDSQPAPPSLDRKPTSINAPHYCPVCQHPLHVDGANLVCENILCEGMIVAQVDHMSKKDALNIDGLSVKTISKLFDLGLLKNRFTIFDLTKDAFLMLDGFAEPSANKLHNNIQEARKNVPFHKFLYACGIPLLGRRASKDIANYMINKHEEEAYAKMIVDLAVNGGSELKSISNIGAETISSMRENIETMNLMRECVDIDYAGVVVPAKAPSKQLTFVITGSLFRGTRDLYKEAIERLGHKLSGSVSKKTDYLVTNETTATTKRQKAEELGVPIITEDELLVLLEKNR